ncbi:hypothetical protein [Phytomonospora endophytica]|uniref:Minor tail protein n=1 Tax=Phytomonospora endophytica TaxID=714109 RepID=A0A841FPT3_9ACTN|nr:hypothetical protein [Phytomonospora endophytica]MBB6039311.1 hypothetical protein [Phytomonospora endophytica]GIG69747.1 hypothetical protein Pen01_60420 [Phytomonospora endophytica]
MPLDLADVLRRPRTTEARTALVTGVDGGAVTVNLDGGEITVGHLAAYTPAVGDVVLILATAAGTWYALGKLGATTDPGPNPPPDTPTSGTATFPATAAGSYLDGSARTDRRDVLQGSDPSGAGSNQGAWWYGTAITGTLAGAVVGAGRIWVRRLPGGSQGPVTVYAYAHTATAPTSAPPAIVDGPTAVGALAVGEAAWLPLPAGWAQSLADGAVSGLGLATPDDTGLFLAAAGLASDPQSGAVELDWSAP